MKQNPICFKCEAPKPQNKFRFVARQKKGQKVYGLCNRCNDELVQKGVKLALSSEMGRKRTPKQVNKIEKRDVN